jgi:hypothetical protein
MESIVRNYAPFDDVDLEGVYIWVMWNDETKEWEKVAVVVVSHPVLVGLIDASLEIGNDALALAIVAMGLSLAYGFPRWFDDKGNVRDIWRLSRIVKLTDCPEKINWKVSKFTTNELGFQNGIPAFVI